MKCFSRVQQYASYTNKQPNERTKELSKLKMSTSTTTMPYCAVCHSAGKPKAEYTSHYLRASKAPNAKTTCPYLLALTCGYCKGKGHTPKYCPVSKQNEQKQAQAPAQKAPVGQKVPAPAQKAQASAAPARQAKTPNKFALLQELMDEEEETAERVAREKQEAEEQAREFQKTFPAMALPAPASVPAPVPAALAPAPAAPAGASWAKIAGMPKAQKPAKSDLPYNDDCPEMQKHFRKTIAVMFREKTAAQVESENAVEVAVEKEAYSCGYSWADE